MSIPRELASSLRRWGDQYPAVTLIGPRQSGKTTLVKATFPDKPYVNLEDLQERSLAIADPRGFLARFGGGAIIDEIQNVPSLLGQLQMAIDAEPTEGRFILTGSNQAALRAGIGASLAGRTAIGRLFPFTLAEITGRYTIPGIDHLIQKGFYPRIWDKDLDPVDAIGFYIATYVERDLRAVQAIKDITRFQNFLMLCAGRVGRLLNVASLASDAGVSPNTVKDWLSILEAGFIVFRLTPWHANVGKRLVKAPKLYFWDVGLANWLLGNREPGHIAAHPLKGNLFENLIVADTLKRDAHSGGRRGYHFFRDNHGLEADLLIEDGPSIDLIEIKSGQTAYPEAWKNLGRVRAVIGKPGRDAAVYGGDDSFEADGVRVHGWRAWMAETAGENGR